MRKANTKETTETRHGPNGPSSGGVFTQTEDLIFLLAADGTCAWASAPGASAVAENVELPTAKERHRTVCYKSAAGKRPVRYIVTVENLPTLSQLGYAIGIARPLTTKREEWLWRMRQLAPWIVNIILATAVAANWALDIYMHFIK